MLVKIEELGCSVKRFFSKVTFNNDVFEDTTLLTSVLDGSSDKTLLDIEAFKTDELDELT
jgi:hypothetical protein